MQIRRLLGFGLAAVALVGCNQGPPTTGQPTDFGSVCDKANDGHRVAVIGYMRLPDQITLETDRGGNVSRELVVIRLYQDDDFEGSPIGIDMDFGSGPNTMDELPTDSYTDEDLKVHLADGRTATYGDHVKVSGTVYFPVGFLKGDDVDFDCGLGNPLVELSS